MLKDFQGLEISTESLDTVKAIDTFIHESLSIGNNTKIIFEAVITEPSCALANIYAAVVHLFARSPDSISHARYFLDIAIQCRTNEREQRYLASVDAWVKGDIFQAIARSAVPKAIAHHEVIAEVFPQDLLSLHICQYHQRNSGDSEGMLRVAQKVFSFNQNNSYMLGMLAYALEENLDLLAAEEMGRRATEIQHNNRWAHHAVVHALENRGCFEDGIAWVNDVCDTWEESTPAFRNHLWWHACLFYLDAENTAKVLELYDNQIWGHANKENWHEQINSISLLLRMELRGIDVRQRWQEIATYLQGRVHERILGYHDLHYVYALVRAHRYDWINQILANMCTHADSCSVPYVGQVWTEVAIPGACAMIANAQQDWGQAIALFEQVRSRLQEIGGTNIQQDLFEQVYIDALINVDRNQAAFELLTKRAALRQNIPAVERLLSAVGKKLASTIC